jgi:hypothetical protein
VPLAEVTFVTRMNLNIDEVMATPESELAFTVNYKSTVAAETNTTTDAVKVISIKAGSIVVDSRILLFDEDSVQAVTTQLMESHTTMSDALATSFDTTVEIDPASVSLRILISPPPPLPPPLPPTKQDASGMNLTVIVSGAAAGGTALLLAVLVYMCYRAWGADKEQETTVHVVSDHRVHPVPLAPGVQAYVPPPRSVGMPMSAWE